MERLLELCIIHLLFAYEHKTQGWKHLEYVVDNLMKDLNYNYFCVIVTKSVGRNKTEVHLYTWFLVIAGYQSKGHGHVAYYF